MHNNGLPIVNGEVETSAIRTQGNYRDFVATMLRHGRDALPTWDSIAYWERGTKGSGSGF